MHNLYVGKDREKMIESGELNPAEEGFMVGFCDSEPWK